jgi:hypothetical protein
MENAMNIWPSNYDPTTGTAPTLYPNDCMASGTELARKLTTDKYFADAYLSVVKQHYRDPSTEHFKDYAALMAVVAVPGIDAGSINQHDVANIHRAAWLKIVRSLARLVALNPFQSSKNTNQWADPPPQGTARAVDLPTTYGPFFFKIPNPTGYYAISNTDFDAFEEMAVGTLYPNP